MASTIKMFFQFIKFTLQELDGWILVNDSANLPVIGEDVGVYSFTSLLVKKSNCSCLFLGRDARFSFHHAHAKYNAIDTKTTSAAIAFAYKTVNQIIPIIITPMIDVGKITSSLNKAAMHQKIAWIVQTNKRKGHIAQLIHLEVLVNIAGYFLLVKSNNNRNTSSFDFRIYAL